MVGSRAEWQSLALFQLRTAAALEEISDTAGVTSEPSTSPSSQRSPFTLPSSQQSFTAASVVHSVCGPHSGTIALLRGVTAITNR